jgi:PAS domain S-box-containing protein
MRRSKMVRKEKEERKIKDEKKLSAIYDLSKEIPLSLDSNEIIKRVFDTIETVLNFGNIDLFLVDEEKDELYLKECRGLKEPEIQTRVPIHGEKGITAYVVRTGESLNIPDVRKDNRYIFGLKGSRSELCVPLKVRDKILGVIDAESTKLGAFSENDRRLLETMASQTAVAIQNAQLYEQAQQEIQEKKQSEIRLKDSEELYKSLSDLNKKILENSPAGVMNVNEEMEVEYVNTEMVRILSLPFGKEYQATAMKIAEVPLIEELGISLIFDELKRGDPISEEASFTFPHGERGYLTVKGVPLFENGEFAGAVLIVNDITERKKAEIEVQRRAKEQTVLYDLAQNLTTHLSVKEVLEETYRQASRLIDTRNFYLAFYDEEKAELRFPFLVTESEIDKELTSIPLGGISEYIICNKTGVLIEEDMPTWLEDHGIELVGEVAKSWLGVPLIVGDTILGVMVVQNYTIPNIYDEHDQELFTSIANQAAIAIQNAQLYEQAQQEIEERQRAEKIQSVLHEIANAVNITESLHELFESIKTHLGTVIDTANFSIALYDKETETVSLPYLEDEKDKFRSFPAEKTLTSYVIKENRPVMLREKDKKNLIRKGVVEPVGAPSKVWLGVPLRVGKEVIGVVAVQSYTDSDLYTEDDLKVLGFISDQIAIAIERKQAETALQNSKKKIEQLHTVAAKIEVAQSEDEVYQLIVDIAEKILEFDMCVVHVAEGNLLKARVLSSGIPAGGGGDIAIDEGIGGKTYRERKSYLIHDMSKKTDAKQSLRKYQSGISVPIENIGIFQAMSSRLNAFNEEDVELTELLMSHVTQALNRVQVEKELQESEEKYRSIVENSHVGILVVDENYKFTYVNDKLCEILGHSHEKIIGHDFRKFLDKESEHLVSDRYIRRQRGEKVPSRYEFTIMRKDGERRRVEISSTIIRNAAGNVRTVAQILDVTERKYLEDQRENVKKEAELYADVLAHDIGNINQITLSYLHLLESTEDIKKRKKQIGGIKRSIMKSARLVNDLKILKNIEKRKMARINLNKSLERAIDRIRTYSDREIEVKLSGEKKYYAKGNKFLDEVFVSVLENAVEYTLDDPVQIDITMRRREKRCAVHIRDYGLGIPKEKRKDILMSLDTVSKRTGIGLYLVKKILDQFNGRFEIIDPGRGTEIIIDLPVIQ